MRCLHCNNVFTDNGTEFCCFKHMFTYNKRHNLCSYPEKQNSFWVAEDAWDFIDGNDELFKENLRPFMCTCGMLHIGHGEPNEYSREKIMAMVS